MSIRKLAVVGASFLVAVTLATAASRNNTTRITVLDSETRSAPLDDNGVPKNCDQVTFDAYCRSSRAAPLINTLVVQEAGKPPIRISCTAQSRFSRCIPLPKGESFDARREKKGVVVYYLDDKGKLRSELYTLVEESAKSKPAAKVAQVATPANAAAANTTGASAAPDESSSRATASATETSSQASANEPPVVPAKNVAQAPAEGASPAPVQSTTQVTTATGAGTASTRRETVKCSFSSTPSGAEVTVDGRYVGSTPSVLGMTTGTHVVVVSMAGFTQWKRELAVTAGSELTVNAVLQKAQ